MIFKDIPNFGIDNTRANEQAEQLSQILMDIERSDNNVNFVRLFQIREMKQEALKSVNQKEVSKADEERKRLICQNLAQMKNVQVTDDALNTLQTKYKVMIMGQQGGKNGPL